MKVVITTGRLTFNIGTSSVFNRQTELMTVICQSVANWIVTQDCKVIVVIDAYERFTHDLVHRIPIAEPLPGLL